MRKLRVTATRALIALLLPLLAAACGPRILDLDDVRPSAQLLDAHMATIDGLSLPYRTWRTEGEPKAIIVALHGYNDYSSFFDAPARYLTDHGIQSYAYDQRGFGNSQFRGRWFTTDRYIADARDFTMAIAKRHPGVPLYLLGESMGGAVAMTLVAKKRPSWIKGTILSAPAVWGREAMPVFQSGLLWVAAHVAPGVRLTGRGLKIKPSDNIEMLRALGRDPVVIKGSRIDSIYGLVGLMDRALSLSADLDTPSLILYGAKDEIIRGGPTKMMLERLPPVPDDRRRIAVYADGYHMLLRDRKAYDVWRDIAHWIEDPQSPLPSEAEKAAAIYMNSGSK